MARIVVIRSPFCLKFRKHWFLTENNFAQVFQKKPQKTKKYRDWFKKRRKEKHLALSYGCNNNNEQKALFR